MRLGELFKDITTDPDYEGWVTTNNMVLAIDISEGQNADVDSFAVAYMGGTSKSSSLNPEEKTNSYYYHGKSTLKTGNQRTIDFEFDRYAGDDLQDHLLSHGTKYAIGNAAVRRYVYLDTLTGKGELGSGTISVTDDGSGSPEDNLSVKCSIKKVGENPAEITYQGLGGYDCPKNEPADWSTAYTSYFTRKDGGFAAVTGASAPAWETGKYYKQKAPANQGD